METYEPLLPTPSVADTFTGNLKSSQQSPTSKHSVNLSQIFQHPLYSQAASPANLSPKLDEERERQMTATSGRKCYELYESFIRGGLSVKTLAASLLGAKVWFSNKCTLTWKVKVTKSNRLLFQLSPSMHHTGEIGYGLLPTARAGNPGSRPNKKGGKILAEQIEMLPTPRGRDGVKGTDRALVQKDGKWVNEDKNGTRFGLTAEQAVNAALGQKTGLKLQPAFVEWMMGFPEGWTEIPDSKLLEMRLSRKLRKK